MKKTVKQSGPIAKPAKSKTIPTMMGNKKMKKGGKMKGKC